MRTSCLLDTGFLISMVNSKRNNHTTALRYFRFCVDNSHSISISTIALAEFAIKQSIQDLPLKFVRLLPFNVDDADESARLDNLLDRDSSESRQRFRDDVKMIAQANLVSIAYILTEDASSLHKYCGRLNQANEISCRAINISEGFDGSLFNPSGQKSLLDE